MNENDNTLTLHAMRWSARRSLHELLHDFNAIVDIGWAWHHSLWMFPRNIGMT